MGLILHVVPDLGLNGPARQVSILAPLLVGGHWSSHVATLHRTGVFEPTLRAANVPIHDLGGTRRVDARPWLRLRRLIGELRPILVHARGRAAIRLAALFGRCDGGPPLIASDIDSGESPGWFDRWLLKTAGCIVASSELGCKHLKRAGVTKARVQIIPSCVAPVAVPTRAAALRELQIPMDARIIACAGVIESGRGFRRAIWVFDILKYVYPDIWLLVLGDGPQRNSVENFGRELGRDDFRVRFAGARPDAAGILGLAEVVWVLGERGGRNVALEGMAAGRPIVARRRPELLEILGDGDTGVLVANADCHEAARATRRLLDAPDERRRCGAAARQRAETFAIDRIRPQWEALYGRMSGRG